MQARLRRRRLDGGRDHDRARHRLASAPTRRLAPDVTIEPNVVFGPASKSRRARVSTPSAISKEPTIGKGANIGPFARLRPGADARRGLQDRQFRRGQERAARAEGAKANHLAYLGDAEIGAGANIGAGTITCNYDGFDKYRTEIGEGAFIGSNTALVAPVHLGCRGDRRRRQRDHP